jgi:hypothetical protein
MFNYRLLGDVQNARLHCISALTQDELSDIK